MTHSIYLPFIVKNYPPPMLGTHVVNPNIDRMQYAVDGQFVAWIIEYHKVDKRLNENEPIDWDWSLYDKQFENIGEFPHWLQVKYTPPWMRSIEDLPCSAPKEEYWEDFAVFVANVIQRYDPFAFEIWNEPEVPPEVLEDMGELSGVLGCWENGSYFGEFLAYIYDRVKPLFPNKKMMGGALMLDCDAHFEFAEEMCKTGKFDVLSFHAYPGFGLKNYHRPFDNVVRLREIMERVGRSWPLWLSETSYRSYELYDGLFEEQNEYLKHLWANAPKYGLKMMAWYTLANNTWCNTDLVDRRLEVPCKDVYYTFKDYCTKAPFMI